jgi:two-component system, LytTR family, response regulator LytT
MRIFVVEDEQIHLDDISITIEELGHELVGNSDDAMEAFEKIEQLQPDVVLMDINLNGKNNGILLAAQVHSKLSLPIIFTTSFTQPEIIEQAIAAAPVKSYLVKPVAPASLRAILLLLEKQSDEPKVELDLQDQSFFVRMGNKLKKVSFEDILYLETDVKNYTTIITHEHEKLSVKKSISELMQLLPASQFVQTFRSNVINLSRVSSINEKDQMVMIDKYAIPIGRSYKDELYKRMNIL